LLYNVQVSAHSAHGPMASCACACSGKVPTRAPWHMQLAAGSWEEGGAAGAVFLLPICTIATPPPSRLPPSRPPPSRCVPAQRPRKEMAGAFGWPSFGKRARGRGVWCIDIYICDIPDTRGRAGSWAARSTADGRGRGTTALLDFRRRMISEVGQVFFQRSIRGCPRVPHGTCSWEAGGGRCGRRQEVRAVFLYDPAAPPPSARPRAGAYRHSGLEKNGQGPFLACFWAGRGVYLWYPRQVSKTHDFRGWSVFFGRSIRCRGRRVYRTKSGARRSWLLESTRY
jgi:hypothetical protein